MTTQSNSWLHNVYEELRRRRVIRAATIYVVAMWPVIQIADILSPALNLPNSSMQLLLFIFVAGFPLVLILSWLFNITPKGVVRVSVGDADQAESEQSLLGRKTEVLLIGSLLLAVVVLFAVQASMKLSDGDEISGSKPGVQSGIQSIAVLPFVSFSEHVQDQFFADGLTEELLNVLSRIRNLRVAARTSSFAYKGVSKDVREIGTELNVGFILEGSVRRNDIDDTVRVTAQLIDIAAGSHLWSQTFDRKFRDIFKIQDGIAAAVVDKLEVTLLGNERKQIASRASASAEAMVAQSMGRTELAKRTTAGLQDAARFFQKAIDADPEFAEAHCGLADAFSLLVNYGHAKKQEYLQDAQASVRRALELDDQLGAGWASQGLIYMQQGKNEEAKAVLEKAMQLNPSYAMAYMWYANLEEDASKRLAYYRQAFELDPRSPVAGYNVANSLIEAGREEEAMDVFSKIVEADPYYPGAYKLVAQINQFRGRLDEAILQYKKVYDLQEDGEIAYEIAELYIDLGDFINADRWVQLASQDVPDEYQVRLSWLKVSSLMARGDRDGAVELLKPILAAPQQDGAAFMNASLAGYYLGDFSTAIAAYEKAPYPMQTPKVWQSMDTVIDASIGAAYAYTQLQQSDRASEALGQVDAMLEEKMRGKTRIHPDTWYRKALVLAIQGDRQMALVNLQRAVDEGWSHHWRPFVEPCLVDVLPNSNFKSMMAGLQARMNLMREQLAFEESFRDRWRG